MSSELLDVVGIGNAIVDVVSHADDAFLTRHDLAKGAMTLIDADRAEQLYGLMGPGIEVSGGSAGNTMAGIASLGGRGGYIGKVRNDQLGEVFAHDLRSLGVEFTTPLADGGAPTARCLIQVTPDGQRTMNTYLGACTGLGPDDIEPEQIARARLTYMEGYLWDPPGAKEAFRKAAKIAHAAGRQVSISLSDAFCVDRWRDEFRHLVEAEVDVLFANEDELISLFQVKDFDDALQALRGGSLIAALTRSEQGSVVVRGEEVHVIDAAPIARLVDSTGAGDLYASGFLYGLTRDYDLHTCGRLGSAAAAEVIQHVGARPDTPLDAIAAEIVG
ncbi:MAG: adenosine kinase [Alphaproteobacteria bacterium]|jgi:sugar/nucleoside kinase (ribokinase family)|nr:adenosine kinase [Alphaproteobacteria bacterium]MDP6269015.1 adenosine kinase [Alphaproteobacteria bacterium]MDP7426688.1 adenosine kinase [Alphaproteobacteria bacterium]